MELVPEALQPDPSHRESPKPGIQKRGPPVCPLSTRFSDESAKSSTLANRIVGDTRRREQAESDLQEMHGYRRETPRRHVDAEALAQCWAGNLTDCR